MKRQKTETKESLEKMRDRAQAELDKIDPAMVGAAQRKEHLKQTIRYVKDRFATTKEYT